MTAPIAIPGWATWGQRCGLVLPRYRGLGPGGRRICRWCDNECQPPRRVWCSQECINAYNLVWSWGAVRDYVIRRDKGTCGLCGTTDPEILEGMKGIRFDPWDVDHIVPVADGGTDDPANLRLLCMACHVAVGYEQRAARSPEVDDAQHVLDLERAL